LHGIVKDDIDNILQRINQSKNNSMKAVIKISRDSYEKVKHLSVNKLIPRFNNSNDGLWTGIKRYAH
jgi:uncharacterized protein YdbL (DUF1318 family)